MKTRSRILGLAATVVAIPLLLTGCFASSSNNPNAISVPSGKGVVATSPNTSATPAPTTSDGKQIITGTASASDAKQAWSSIGIGATPGHSKAEVQQAVFSAENILSSTYSNKYMLSGGWSTDSYNIQGLYAPFASFFKNDTFTGYLKLANKLATGKTDTAAQNAVFLVTPYFPDGGSTYTICNSKLCQVAGYPKVTPVSAADTAQKDNIYVKLTVENRFYTTLANGTKGYIPDTTTVELNMVPNTDKTNSATLPYVIAGWKGTDGKQAFVAQ